MFDYQDVYHVGVRVRDLLTGHPLVESFRDGEPSEGGTGATVAALKVG